MNIYIDNKIFTHIYKKSILLMKCTENEPSISYTQRCRDITNSVSFIKILFCQFVQPVHPLSYFRNEILNSAQAHLCSLFLICLIIRTLVIRITNYPDRLDSSGKFVENSTELTCLEITGYRITYSTVLWLLELQIRRGRKV